MKFVFQLAVILLYSSSLFALDPGSLSADRQETVVETGAASQMPQQDTQILEGSEIQNPESNPTQSSAPGPHTLRRHNAMVNLFTNVSNDEEAAPIDTQPTASLGTESQEISR